MLLLTPSAILPRSSPNSLSTILKKSVQRDHLFPSKTVDRRSVEILVAYTQCNAMSTTDRDSFGDSFRIASIFALERTHMLFYWRATVYIFTLCRSPPSSHSCECTVHAQSLRFVIALRATPCAQYTFFPSTNRITTEVQRNERHETGLSLLCFFRCTRRTRAWCWRTSTARIRTRRTRRTSCASSPSRIIQTIFASSFS